MLVIFLVTLVKRLNQTSILINQASRYHHHEQRSLYQANHASPSPHSPPAEAHVHQRQNNHRSTYNNYNNSDDDHNDEKTENHHKEANDYEENDEEAATVSECDLT